MERLSAIGKREVLADLKEKDKDFWLFEEAKEDGEMQGLQHLLTSTEIAEKGEKGEKREFLLN